MFLPQMHASRRPNYAARLGIDSDDDVLDERFNVLEDKASVKAIQEVKCFKDCIKGIRS
jgi:hypothetical protein